MQLFILFALGKYNFEPTMTEIFYYFSLWVRGFQHPTDVWIDFLPYGMIFNIASTTKNNVMQIQNGVRLLLVKYNE